MRRFASLYAGRTDCFGRYLVAGGRQDGKQKGRGQTVHEPLTDEVFAAHLSGQIRLGVVPIRVDSSVSWFAGDIDDYSVNLLEIETKAQAAGFPLVVCRSKSGGAHLYCFIRGTAPATSAIKAMRSWLAVLGYPRSEVFPKQDTVTEESTGNWINLPYHNGDDADNYAIGLTGEKLTLAEFEQMANARAITPAELETLAGVKAEKPKKARGEFADAPPCVAQMAVDKVTEGGRNTVLTHVGIFYRKSDPDNWQEKLIEWNALYIEPRLPTEEVRQIARSLAKDKYEYFCKQEPMCSICQKDLCLTRKWGVGPQHGEDYSDYDIDRIVKITSDPPIFYVIMNGDSIKMDPDTLFAGSKFRKRVWESTGRFVTPLKQIQHEKRLKAAKMEIESAPQEVSDEGAILEIFRDWCEARVPNTPNINEVRRGNPYYDPDRKAVVFRSQDFINVYRRVKRFNAEDREVWASLRSSGCIRDNVRIEGEQTKCWLFPVEKPWFNVPGEEAF